jgi:hypothetical protein
MLDLLLDPGFWAALFSVTLVQIALGADNLIIITILAGKLPPDEQQKAVRWGLILAMAFRLILLAMVSWVLRFTGEPFHHFDTTIFGIHFQGALSVKALVLVGGGLFLIWSGVKELRMKIKGIEHEVEGVNSFGRVLTTIVGLNLLFSVDSILTVVGMTDIYLVMAGSVVISVVLMHDRHLPRDGRLGRDLRGPDAGLRQPHRQVHARQPRFRDPRSLRAAADRLRALPRGRSRGTHDGQRRRVPLHPAVDHDLHSDAHVLGGFLPELARTKA